MTKQSKVKLSVISLLLAVAVGAPVASIVANAPSHRSTAALEPTTEIEMPADVLTSAVTIETVDIEASPSPARHAAPKKARGGWRCVTRDLEQGRGAVKACGEAI